MRASVVTFAILSLLASSGCGLGYSSALGFRAKQAVDRHDVEAFKELMSEAAETLPKGPRDNPKKTVLTHFLDLAEDPHFFPYLAEWRANGWVADEMACSINRAHARQVWDLDHAAAWQSVERALELAREGARNAEKSWLVADCLEGASFLTQSSTIALIPLLERATDPTEPLKFRVALIDGMTRIPVTSLARRQMNNAALTREQATRVAEAELELVERRFEWIVAAAKPLMETTLLASGSAVGAMEIEDASLGLGRSYIGRYARSENVEESDLAWAWVRSMKVKKKNTTLIALGLWDRAREPRADVYWYACIRPTEDKAGANVLGPMSIFDAVTLRSKARVADLDALRRERCIDAKTKTEYPEIFGPYPLESTARGHLAGELSKKQDGARTVITLKRRLILDADKSAPEPEETPDAS